MEYKHKSGAQKRKEKADTFEKTKLGSRTLFQFGISKEDKSEPVITPTRMVANEVSGSIVIPQEENINNIDENTEIIETIERVGFDVGTLPPGPIPTQMIETVIRNGPPIHPDNFPADEQRAFPKSIFKVARQNGEVCERDWLVWSKIKESLFCFPCRLFSKVAVVSSRSILSSDQGWSKQQTWRKLYDKVPAHEKSDGHKKCYIQWRESERRFLQGKDIESQMDKEMASKVKYWRDLLKRILAVVLFLGERGLAFRGSSNKIDDHNNGNFLGVIELLAQFDPVLEEHVSKVKQSQNSGQRLQAHYLSADSQNDFIEACSSKVVQEIHAERERSKYYSILVDATPDCSHTEQSTFILRYILDCNSTFVVKERFLAFVDYNKKLDKILQI